MQTLSANQELNKGVKMLHTLILKKENVKAEKNRSALITKFGKENVEKAQIDFYASIPVVLPANKIVNTLPALINNNAAQSTNDALSDANGLSEAEINHDLLKNLSALGIADKVIAQGGKSIFKKDFNNKADRTKCRNAFQSALARMLVHTAHNKKDLADKELINIKAIADKYYLAESTFKNVGDYCTDNMQADKKGLIKLFIDIVNPAVA